MTLPDGEIIKIGNGEGVSAAVTIHNPSFFKRCVLYGDIGFGEGYVDGDWDTESITDVIKWFILNVEHAPTVSGSNVKAVALNLMKFYNRLFHSRRDNSLSGSRKNISEHYDLSNDFFALWLDPTMTYSSAYFKEENFTLEEAQKAKYQRLCEQLQLKPTDHVLEIGSGWGGNAIYMASNFGCKVTTITISEEQQKLANERVKAAGLNDKISVEIQDYRKIKGQYDKIVSVEMLEAVGARYFENYFEQCHKLLKQDGILALQVITCPDSRFEALRDGVDWIQKHIFPGSLLPSVGAMNEAINRTGDLTLVDLKDLGLHYARTLRTWFENFNTQLEETKQLGFSDAFIRKWNYYLCYCEAAFEMRNINVMQLVYARPNNTGR
ncbi:MAG: cyclopropane-fatty-acyl-phospholipid synthase [Candidatus Fluviicola riflensis]|nr:MAG: cyclopropane-fatty-acyl-phospholipid synthase [Candidatus Fluviicola riflensis]OGS87249.1 MAG: cyclopropane-fatty-acyl-phospholipid synthase [Fluviicola sp. RIFCSPHIGHO2_01_FULL_43_53]OGS88995.1 MAG: cyclopropane-fatty-acyl-phospholipid synthase [Fluviicola sp. RIFCSPHIGHO2_12_FULL_43_24]